MRDENVLRLTINPSPSPFDLFGEIPDWEGAVCLTVGPDPWFPDMESRGDRVFVDEQRAVELCKTCPRMDDCANFAVENRMEYGIWGGLTKFDRETIWAQDEAEATA